MKNKNKLKTLRVPKFHKRSNSFGQQILNTKK